MKPLIIGEAPSRAGNRYWQFPLSGLVGKRLCIWAGLSPDDGGSPYGRYYWPLRERFDLMNLIERWPGPQGRGAAFPAEQARVAFTQLDLRGRVVVLLGRRISDAVGLQIDFYDWLGKDTCSLGCDLVAIPHPSGLNRRYNDDEHVLNTERTLREALRRAG